MPMAKEKPILKPTKRKDKTLKKYPKHTTKPHLTSLSLTNLSPSNMQRQSLGSPSSKLHIHGGEEISDAEEQKRRVIIDDDDDGKDTKPRRLSFSPSSSSLTSSPKPEKLIHLIPVLTLVCFLILYLTSHNPSQSDLAQFNGFKHSSKHLDSREISDVGRFIEFQKGDVLAIRSMRNLQELDKYVPKSRPHRKIADFQAA
ncbi:hypothetical protein REPUB_Repub07fG0239200 [Reevesia pubescens]